MPKTDFTFTRGEIPRYSRSLSPDGYADCAINTKLWHGILQSFPCPVEVCEKPFNIKTIVPGCNCLAYDKVVDIVEGFCDLSFKTGDGCPMVTDNLCADDWCRLGVPCPPSSPPQASAGDNCSAQVSRLVYRYVNKFGQVGPPSLPSNETTIGGGGTLSGIVIPSAEWCVTHVDVFASMAGLKTGQESSQTKNSGTMFMGRFPLAGAVSGNFSVANGSFELDSEDNFPPACALQGITKTDHGLLAFEGKNMWYTKAGQPNAWNNYKCLDHDIIAVEYWNGRAFAFTDCLIYSFPVQVTEDGYDFGLPFTYGNAKMPLIGNRNSLASGQLGILYPTNGGIAIVNDRQIKIISDRLFAIDDWCRIDTDSMVAAYNNYGYAFFNNNVSYMIETPDGSIDLEQLNAYRLPFNATAATTDCDGVLQFADGNTWYQWDQCRDIKHTFDCCDDPRCLCRQCCPYFYKTVIKRFEQEIRLTDGVIQFDGSFGDVNVKIYDGSCRDRLIYEGDFNLNAEDCANYQCDRKYFVLDSCRLVESVFIVLEGCADVRRISLGTARSAL